MLSPEIQTGPLFLKYLTLQKRFSVDPVVILDIGARGGFQGLWANYDDQVRLVGFETDPKECERLNREKHSTREIFYPVAIGKKKEIRLLYIANWPYSSGLYPADMDFWKRFPDEQNLRVVDQRTVETVDLDSFCRDEDLSKVDFIKLDIEGAELDALEGAIHLLRESVIGVSVEVGFCSYRLNMPIFSEVDSFLRPLGFDLFDISCYRHARKSFPEPLYAGEAPGFTRRGQVIWGEALYLRDAYKEIRNAEESRPPLRWDETSILKLCTFFELFNLQDCAIELLQLCFGIGYFKEKGIDVLTDLLARNRAGDEAFASYKQYMEAIERRKTVFRDKKSNSANSVLRAMRKIVRLLPKRIKSQIHAIIDASR
jgi:FkbM family methyltransferase